jgi:hypothetical protein
MHHATGCHLVDGVFHPKTLVLRSVHFRFSLPAHASTSSRINELLKTPRQNIYYLTSKIRVLLRVTQAELRLANAKT